jgi:DNA-binding CsgD family transcriptional regulator
MQGIGRLVVLSGEAGIGKTRLVREVADRAVTTGMRVRTGRAVQASAPIPYRPVIEALQGTPAEDAVFEDPALDAYRPGLRRLLGRDAGRDPVAVGSPLALMAGLLRLVRLLADDRGLLLVFEDLHWADEDTLAVMEYFADHLESVPVLCLGTERTETSAPASELISALTARRAVERIELSPLAEDEVEEMARLTLGVEQVPAGLVSALHRRAAGIPFLIEEMLSAYQDAGGPEERRAEWWISRRIADALPHSYREVVRSRLAVLEPSVRETVDAAAVLGRSFDWRLLATMAAAEEPEVLGRLRAAVRVRLIAPTAGLAPAFEFRHALAREAVLAELLPPERAALSALAAEAIAATHQGLPGDWCQRVADLWEDAGEPLLAMGALQEAARRAIVRSALASAEHLLTRARVLAGDDLMAWMGVDDLLLDTLVAAGKPERVRELGSALIDVYGTRYRLRGERIARFHLKVARGLVPAGEWDAVHTHLEHARRAAGPAPDASLLVGIDALATRAALATGAPERALEFAASATKAAARSASSDARCEALDAEGRAAIAAGDLHRGVALFSRCFETATRSQLRSWEASALLELGTIDEISRGELQQLDAARSAAAGIGAVAVQATANLRLAWGHLGRAQLEEALAALECCIEACRLHRLELLSEALTALCMLHALKNELSELERAAREALTTAASPASEAGVLGNGHAVLALVHGDEAASLAHLDAAAAYPPHGAQWSLLWLHGLRALLRAATGSAEAIEEAGPSADHDPRVAGYLAFARSIVDGRRGGGERAASGFASAERAMPAGWRREHARLVVARSAFADGWGEPERWMREALTFLDSTPLVRFSAACKALLRKAGAPVPRRGRGESAVPASLRRIGVTSREMDVLYLVGERLSNKEIGERLYLSPRTIEGHVASLIRKLSVQSRSELINAARSLAQETTEGMSSET